MKNWKKKFISWLLRNNEWRHVIDNIDNATQDLMAGKYRMGQFVISRPNKWIGKQTEFRVRIDFAGKNQQGPNSEADG